MTQIDNINKICRLLTEEGRHVTDDAALNRLLTHVETDSGLRSKLAKIPDLWNIIDRVITDGESLPPNNSSFLIQLCGLITTEITINSTTIQKFINLNQTDWFKSSGSLRNAWLLVLPGIYRLKKSFSLEHLDSRSGFSLELILSIVSELFTDNSIFVRRLSYRVIADLIITEDATLIVQKLDNIVLKEVLVIFKNRNQDVHTINKLIEAIELRDKLPFHSNFMVYQPLLLSLVDLALRTPSNEIKIQFENIWDSIDKNQIRLRILVYFLAPARRDTFHYFATTLEKFINQNEIKKICIMLDTFSEQISRCSEDEILSILW